MAIHFRYYNKRKIRRTLTVRQYNELQDSRVVLGITVLFYATNILPLYIRSNNNSEAQRLMMKKAILPATSESANC